MATSPQQDGVHQAVGPIGPNGPTVNPFSIGAQAGAADPNHIHQVPSCQTPEANNQISRMVTFGGQYAPAGATP